MSPLADSDAACRCVWVCMAACGGGGDGRKSMFCRDIVLMIGCMYDWVHVSSVFKKILGIVMILWLFFSITNL